jgi:hypothetical protein
LEKISMKKITMTDLNSLEETHNEAIEATKSHVESVKAEPVASARRVFHSFSGRCQCPDGTYKKNCC